MIGITTATVTILAFTITGTTGTIHFTGTIHGRLLATGICTTTPIIPACTVAGALEWDMAGVTILIIPAGMAAGEWVMDTVGADGMTPGTPAGGAILTTMDMDRALLLATA